MLRNSAVLTPTQLQMFYDASEPSFPFGLSERAIERSAPNTGLSQIVMNITKCCHFDILGDHDILNPATDRLKDKVSNADYWSEMRYRGK